MYYLKKKKKKKKILHFLATIHDIRYEGKTN